MDAPPSSDGADAALAHLIDELAAVVDDLSLARQRARQLQELRATGQGWYEIVSGEDRPLIVEQISTAMGSLATAGGQWRREQAAALSREDVSINRIAALYGVTRQRVSALLRDRGATDVPAEDAETVE